MAKMKTFLVVCAGGHHCGLPVEHVIETFRPLPVEALGDVPAFVLGLARVRGEATPILNLALLLNAVSEVPLARFISLRIEGRGVVLAVESVGGLRDLSVDELATLPPLFSQEVPVVEALSGLDQGLFLVLRAARLLPPTGLSKAGIA